MITIAVVGSRTYPKLEDVDKVLDEVQKVLPEFILITGGARGVDRRADDWAVENNIDSEIYEPKNIANKIDYLFRNVEIITKADIIYVFWDGTSKGSKFVIDYAKFRQKPMKIIRSDEQ